MLLICCHYFAPKPQLHICPLTSFKAPFHFPWDEKCFFCGLTTNLRVCRSPSILIYQIYKKQKHIFRNVKIPHFPLCCQVSKLLHRCILCSYHWPRRPLFNLVCNHTQCGVQPQLSFSRGNISNYKETTAVLKPPSFFFNLWLTFMLLCPHFYMELCF